ncbi:5'-nucleotidase C-terminal domain-containing protein [Fusobacterium sp.]|uniref:5'-nucleotidase C-terminal domain-containing protein n=1 Tax=Fusobacterium sp. TaxID=68766 RepID=UPI002629DBAF|nr:5'-nucleotidase C-terminal domain-containing protein [Fusobacterium sp.]
MKKIFLMMFNLFFLFQFAVFSKELKEVNIKILATSDIHNKFYPYDYSTNEESKSGSLVQIASAIEENRDKNTIIIDVGDTIQDNSADLFFDEKIHPMVLGFNEIGYDIWVSGNHEFNYGVENLKNVVKQFKGKFLSGNVYNPDGTRLGDNYTIIEKSGVKILVIGMVTPNIVKWDYENLKGYKVTDPVEETKKIIAELKDKVDVIVVATHMGESNEYGVKNSGVDDLANACPEIDVILAAHEHKLVEGVYKNNVLIIENKSSGATLAEIDIKVAKDGNKFKVVDRKSRSIKIANYEPEKKLAKKLAKFDLRARQDANVVIGELKGGNLAPANEIAGIPQAQIESTALIGLINEVQHYYTGARVSAAALFIMDANLEEGKIKKSDTSLIYKFGNTLYKLEMNGKQLKKFMEWSANYYNQYKPGDLTISFDENVRGYNYDMFYGVDYEIDISKEKGNRIKNLKWSDTKKPVKDDEVFVIAVNNYRANSQLLNYGEVFDEKDGLPKVLEIDVKGNLGGVRELIGDYIINVKGGVITPNNPNNWKIIGNDWDESQHKKVVELVKEGKMSIPKSSDGRTPNVRSITTEDLKNIN